MLDKRLFRVFLTLLYYNILKDIIINFTRDFKENVLCYFILFYMINDPVEVLIVIDFSYPTIIK